MRCEEARPRLLAGPDESAEEHLAACDACFAWLEERDPLIELVRQARRSWSPRARWLRLAAGLAAAAVMLAGLAGLVTMVWLLAGDDIGFALSLAQGAAAPVVGAAGSLVQVPGALLLDNPLWLAAVAVIALAASAVWLRLYQDLARMPRARAIR